MIEESKEVKNQRLKVYFSFGLTRCCITQKNYQWPLIIHICISYSFNSKKRFFLKSRCSMNNNKMSDKLKIKHNLLMSQ